MLNNNIKVEILKDSNIKISNNSEFLLENCEIFYSNQFGVDKKISRINLQRDETTTISVGEDVNCVFTIKIFSNHKNIYEKEFNNACLLISSHQNEDDITNDCINSIRKFTNLDIIKFTINYTTSSPDYKNVTLKSLDKEVSVSDICRLTKQFNYKKFIYLDKFLVALNKNFLNKLDLLDKLPLFGTTKEYEIGPILTESLSIKDEVSNLNSDIIYFKREHFPIFEEISSFEKSSHVVEASKFEEINNNIIFSSFFKSKKLTNDKINIIKNIDNSESLKSYLYKNGEREGVSFLCIKEDIVREKTFVKLSKSNFETKLKSFYNNINQQEVRKKKSMQIISHSVNGPFVEIQADSTRKFEVTFLSPNSEVIYRTNLNGNMWTRLNKKFYQEYSVMVKEDNDIIFQDKFTLKNKRVYIALESSSLGDSLAWFPYTEEFRKKHDCQLIVSTFNNDLFESQYPDIQFVKPGEVVNNLSAMYCIGWFYGDDGSPNLDKCPYDFRNQPLQKTAADILGLEFEEVRPKLNVPIVEKQKRVGIAIHGTAQSKYWNNPTGWQEVTDHLISLGYEVVIYSKEGDGYMGNNHPVGATKFPSGSLKDLITGMASCEFFIGIGSGLSWLAWAINLPIVLISGFSEDYTETQTNTWRVINKNVCTGCFNTHKLDPSDWNWCPVNKGTNNQFECTRSITSQMVITEINNLIKLKCRSV
jgi:autotransporter strand-loop-strand O-heptosyltransferase